MKLADVALPVAVATEFTYGVPPELAGSAVPGVRVIVPFGRTLATGIITRLPDSTTIRGLKPIRDVLDPAPVVDDTLLRLCRWISDYYMAPIGEVLRAAIPHGFTPPGKRIAVPVDPGSYPVSGKTAGRSEGRGKILDLLRSEGSLSVAEIQKRVRLKTIHAVLNDLQRQGYLRIEEVVTHRSPRPKTTMFISLERLDAARLASVLETLPPRNTRLRLLAETLLQKKGHEADLTVQELLGLTRATVATLTRLAALAGIQIETRDARLQEEYGIEERTRTLMLNADQRAALEAVSAALRSGDHSTFLVHGVTGSGKTQLYIEAIRTCLSMGRTAIVLVPEISLTPQIVRRFRAHFADDVMVVHSRMAPGERHEVWRRALSGACKVVIGPRSAIFAPLPQPALIVVDEEHESSYKQFDAMPRYHARDVAVVRGSLTKAVVLLGSATPSIESFANARAGKYRLLELPTRVDQAEMPRVAIVDMTAERRRGYAAWKESLPDPADRARSRYRQPSLSVVLREQIADRLSRGEGVILLQNRRGFAPFLECLQCGHVEMCDNCQVTLTYHLTHRHLRCHYCGSVRRPPLECPECRGTDIEVRGYGTQRIEEELHGTFPGARVLRMDLDTTTRKGAHDRILRAFGEGRADILLGTQMVAKGLDFARVTLVGVVSADTQMLLPDFRASERTYQLLTQVAGRAGRSTLKGDVLIQTYQPAHPSLRHVVGHDYVGFFEEELASREELGYPPQTRLVLLEVQSPDEEEAQRVADDLAGRIRASNGFFDTLGAAPAVIARIRKNYRWHVLLKNFRAVDPTGAKLRGVLHAALRDLRVPRTVKVLVDVDPVGLL